MRDNYPTIFAVIVIGHFLIAAAGGAQGPPGMPPTPVRYTEAQNHDLRRSISLTGSVESHRSSLVAAEVEGVVERLQAREGDRVEKGNPLARLRKSDFALRLQALEGQLKEAQARRQLARASLERSQGLSDEKIISRQQLDDAVSEAEAWQGRVAQLEADVSRLRDDLERTTVRAPFSGVVVREHVAEGEWLSEGGAVVELVDLDDLEVTVQVPESSFDGIATGVSAQMRIASLGGLEVEGTVRTVVPQANPQSRTFPVKVALANPDGRIGVGMLASVELPVGERQPTVVVPKDAIVTQGSERFLFVIGEDNTVQRVTVRTGSSEGVWVGVEGEVKPGDRVVTRGNERIFPGQTVDPQPVEYELP
jgi:RND family efflux transporter MFP subunit